MMADIEKQELFPVVDISYIIERYQSVDGWRDKDFQQDAAVRDLVDQICTGFTRWGFLYITGHGIPESDIQNAFNGALEFFNSEDKSKKEVRRGGGIALGYVPHDSEVFDKNRPNDIKEALDFLPDSQLSEKMEHFASKTVSSSKKLFLECHQLVQKFLRLLAMALDLDVEHYISLHKNIGDHKQNGTTMRLLYYPQIKSRLDVQEGQLRCGEHTDYGTVTLLFQDQVGGLEVKSPSGEYVKAKPIPGTIVVNAGDLLHTWSGGRYKATMHRVVPPVSCSSSYRQSIAFFTHPDYAVNIDTKNEQGQSEVRNAHDHLKEMFDRTIQVEH